MRGTGAAALATLLVLLAGCSEPEGSARPDGGTYPTDSGDRTSGTPPTAPSEPAPDDPVSPTEDVAPLVWHDLPGPVVDPATASGPWVLTVAEDGSSASLDGPDPRRFEVPDRHRITDALIDGEFAVVVSEDTLARRGNTATVVELDTGASFRVDPSSSVPTTTGGTWALGEGRLLHATVGPDRSYCLAEVDLSTRASELGWCAPPRHGFNDARITPAGTSLLTFDDGRPSCRTVVEVRDGEVVPFEGVDECRGWDGLVVPDGVVWSVVPRANRIEEALFQARVGESRVDLGPGTSGSLTWCSGAAYFVRDPQRDGDPAELLRWAPGEPPTVVYATRGRGPAFLSAPRCGGDTLSLSVLAESGDRQVAAGLG
jgi:hypothetical protein